MKQTNTIVTALDIGTTKICAIIAMLNEENNLEVKGIGSSKSEGLVNSKVIDIMKTSNSIQAALSEAEAMAECKAQNIYIGIAGDYIKSQNTLGRISLSSANEPTEVTPENLNDVLSNARNNVKIQQGYERMEVIHAIPQYFDIDGQDGIMNPLNMTGFNLTAYVHVVLANMNILQNISKCIQICGYTVQDIVLEPIASSYAVLNEVEKDLGSILIDIGGGTTDIAVFFNNSIRYSAVVPMGGTNVTSDLAIGLHTSPQNAEGIKIDKGNSISRDIPKDLMVKIDGIAGREAKQKRLKYIAEIIEARMREILEGSYKILNEHHELKLITAGLTLTGGASLLKNSERLAEEVFNMSTKIGYPQLDKLSGPTDRLQSPKFATAVGILYYIQQEMQDKKIKLQSYKTPDGFTKLWDTIKKFFKENF
jgi:cell division protein FtsA